MRVFVTGSNGLLGQKLLHTFDPGVYDLYGCDLAYASFVKDVKHDYLQLDLTNRNETVAAIQEIDPSIVIHTAAMTGVDQCELDKEKCWKVNVKVTENVVKAAAKVAARMIFISTDYIFDGENGPYTEDDTPNPISYYGRSKLAAENLVRGSALPWTIARTIVLYGNGIDVHSSFVGWLLGMLRSGRSVNIVDDQWGNTTIVDDLAAGIERIVLLKESGIFNLAGRGFMSRHEFAVKTARFFGLPSDLVVPISTAQLQQPAPRPLKSGLVTDHAERELFLSFRTVEESLRLYQSQEEERAKY